MAEDNDELRLGHPFDAGPFALDLYRLLCIVLADKAVAKITVDSGRPPLPIPAARGVAELQDQYRKAESTRILVSSAVALRIAFDQHPKALAKLSRGTCGVLFPNWTKRTREDLTLREACNKIVHATEIRDDVVIPDKRRNPDQEGSYVRPLLYLYGTKDKQKWRAQLSIVEFVSGAASVFARH